LTGIVYFRPFSHKKFIDSFIKWWIIILLKIITLAAGRQGGSMKTEKNSIKTKVPNRKAVTQAIAKQDMEVKKTSHKNSEEIQEAIRLKAYELYVERGYAPGDPTEDWLAAEKIVLRNHR